ncbi:hypothetical protein Sjap_008026 [Stephania japonica]|uniref:Uncharacterized protein n=1 Tax=Stephania japonica TaxID=461633 RepID=A0AAP0JR25_9MAGN
MELVREVQLSSMAIVLKIENGVAHLGVGIGVFGTEGVERDMDLTELLVA